MTSKRSMSPQLLTLLCAVMLLFFYNNVFWTGLIGATDTTTVHGKWIIASLFIAITALFSVVMMLLTFRFIHKPLLILVVLIAAGVSYFQSSFGVIVDHSMIRNVLETDQAEATELLNLPLILHILLYGLLPAVVIVLVPVRYRGLPRELIRNVLAIVTLIAVTAVVAWASYKDISMIGRENRALRMHLNPSFAINSAVTYFAKNNDTPDKARTPVGRDASKPDHRPPRVLVMMLGETARAQNFSLNGYARDTNPELAKRNVTFYSNVSSCGTATAESVPCIFSRLDRDRFSVSKARGQENVLDIMLHAGVRVVWLENNSSCKGVCLETEVINLKNAGDPEWCNDEECFDDIFVKQLGELLPKVDRDTVFVLHQKGSHGPAYYKRHPENLTPFTPECRSSAPQDCPQQDIVNAYDNTIFYTDHVLGKLIDLLKTSATSPDSALLYVSDHGESLGENGVYLHGLPYFIAPAEQTHVPMLLWQSDAFSTATGVTKSCVDSRRSDTASHDNIFHTLLGMMDVSTEAYDAKSDLLAACRN